MCKKYTTLLEFNGKKFHPKTASFSIEEKEFIKIWNKFNYYDAIFPSVIRHKQKQIWQQKFFRRNHDAKVTETRFAISQLNIFYEQKNKKKNHLDLSINAIASIDRIDKKEIAGCNHYQWTSFLKFNFHFVLSFKRIKKKMFFFFFATKKCIFFYSPE